MTIGPLELPVGGTLLVGLLVGLLVLVQAASTLTASTARTLLAAALLEKRGRTGRMPSPSFGSARAHGYTGRNRSMLAEWP
jgi:hypothetical protein